MVKRTMVIPIWPLAAILLAAPADATIYGHIESMGFPSVRGMGMGQDVVRRGEWMPVQVRLTLDGEESFDGWIRIAQPDKDGDFALDIQPVHLRRGQGRTYWLYTLAGRPTGQVASFAVELVSDSNQRVDLVCRGERARALVPAMAPESLQAHDVLILSIGPTVGRVADLPVQRDSGGSIHVAHLAPESVPPLWQGLQSVDAIVWDRADPTLLSEAQLNALVEWTRQGGVLVIAAGITADTVAAKLGQILPVDIGPARPTTRLPRFRNKMLNLRDETEAEYAKPIVVAQCAAKPGATTIVGESHPDMTTTVVAEKPLGRGTIVFVAAALSDLLGESGDHGGFLKRILHLREAPETRMYYETSSLAAEVDGWIGFKEIGATYLAAAVLLAGLYVFLSTFGAWQFLRTRGWLHHSWSAFALVALGASVVTVLAVQGVRGVGKTLHQLSVVDADAGSSVAQATAYFGLRTSLFGSLDVWLAEDYPQVTEPGPSTCVLHPMAPNTVSDVPLYYADPGRYQMVPSQAELLGVPIRGTLKQFEGRWSGTLPGRLSAQMRVAGGGPGGRYDWRITSDSRITNELGVDLYATFLIYAAQNIYLDDATLEIPNRADKVYAFPLGPLDDKQSLHPAGRIYNDIKGSELEFEDWSKNTLLHAVETWAGDLAGFNLTDFARRDLTWKDLRRHELALLLLSSFAEYQPTDNVQGLGMGRPQTFFTAGSARHLDMSDHLDTETALFIGFARSEGPVTLCTRVSGDDDYRRISPSNSLTMYRIRIPLQ